jgi:hypothetical protein
MEMTPVPSLSSEDGREAGYGRVAKLRRVRPVPGPRRRTIPPGSRRSPSLGGPRPP